MIWLRRVVGRVPRWVRVSVCGIIAGVILGLVAAHWGASPLAGGHYESPGSLLISADQRTLAASAGGGCLSGSLDVRETSSTVTVRMYVWPTPMGSPGICAIQVFSARLAAPLGSRQLIDGLTGARLASFRGQGILRPSHLPTGFVHRYDSAFLNSETVAGASAGCTQVFTQADSYDESIWVSQITGGRWVTPAGVTATPIVVRGQPGLALTGEIEWAQDGQLFIIQSMTYAYATLATPDLIAIANSLK